MDEKGRHAVVFLNLCVYTHFMLLCFYVYLQSYCREIVLINLVY